jgi:glucose-1-phosphate adenylyltransferase
MPQTGRQSLNTSNVLCVIMGGGEGKRLFPLTKDRAKPAVPLAGKYRLVDIPISNCINSGFRRVYILTQFNSASLHSHISRTYKFDVFTAGFVEILAAQQTPTNTSWYEGTADAVRKNLIHFLSHDFDYLIILSTPRQARTSPSRPSPSTAPPRNRSAYSRSPTTSASRASSKSPRTRR